MTQRYDLIGDIHGQAKELRALLDKLGYREADGAYSHPERQVIFLGDFIDRGAHQREVLEIVRSMIEAGHALAVMGNHEYNAIGYATLGADGEHLRVRSGKNRGQHEAFLEAFQESPDEWLDVIEWFKTLPLWLDLEGLRVVHATWDKSMTERLREWEGDHRMSDALLHAAGDRKTPEFDAVDMLLKGMEVGLSGGHFFVDKDGHRRERMRVRWWDQSVTTYREAYMGPEDARLSIPKDPLPAGQIPGYGAEEKPVFIGHYWLTGDPAPLADNIACLDYSVAHPGGKLVAYRWDGEQRLSAEKFVWVERA